MSGFEQWNRDREAGTAESEEYRVFVEKFKPKKTTDDCYTPPNIYDCVADYVEQRYGIPRERFVRPFYPGGDYEREEYPDGCCVVDNPPFSILGKIIREYEARGVRFFLFAPGMTTLTHMRWSTSTCSICAAADIIYENGADVKTNFVTNLEPEIACRSDPELHDRINEINRKNEAMLKRHNPKYTYPDQVTTAARMQYYSEHGKEYAVRRKDCVFIPAMDAQRKSGKSIFGGGLLLSAQAAAAQAAAAQAAAAQAAAAQAAAERIDRTEWELSDRERDMVRTIGNFRGGLDGAADAEVLPCGRVQAPDRESKRIL